MTHATWAKLSCKSILIIIILSIEGTLIALLMHTRVTLVKPRILILVPHLRLLALLVWLIPLAVPVHWI